MFGIGSLFKKKNYPDSYKTYLEGFKKDEKKLLSETRFVVFDTETTGLNVVKDRVLSIGAISVLDNTINVNDTFEVYVQQEVFKSESVEIHEILKNNPNQSKVTEIEAIKQFLSYVKNDILVGHHVGFDIEMMNRMLLRNNLGKLRNQYLDTGVLFKKSKHLVYQENLKNYSLDDLCEELKIEKTDRHTATGDALITAIAFQKILARLDKNGNLKLKDLF
ncbi:3'-5' exonuclease [Aureibaculum sp. 2210JD6-5]|uniref:3'-5' exonuclease n=1 Tax=Aureibaculum sp. 2210JD6-5 TaxID=3103957 RepID=UPI002AAE6770|nr:3'-5' exonuclease [Aureibaculum sp. 2210JD6-5]MDY7395302.1 3'-5' exonuclease [Aureibaculum sp. 2210JD6-5]